MSRPFGSFVMLSAPPPIATIPDGQEALIPAPCPVGMDTVFVTTVGVKRGPVGPVGPVTPVAPVAAYIMPQNTK
jgi:hypothetical protein